MDFLINCVIGQAQVLRATAMYMPKNSEKSTCVENA